MPLLRCLVLALTALLALPALAARPALVVGVLAPEGADAAISDWEGIGRYLGEALPEYEVRLRYFDLAGLREAVAHGRIDFLATNPGHYVDLEAAYGVYRIATLETPQALSPNEAIASAVVVRADRADLKGFADLAGRRVLAASESAFGGYQVAWRALRQQGVEPARDFRELRFAGFPLQKIVLAVGRGEADAGIVRACLLENMARRGEIRLEDFRVLGVPAGDRYPCLRSTPLYPDWPMAALKATPHALSKRFATALLAMPPTAEGVGWTVPTDYQSVHALFRELAIGPYAQLGEPSFRAFLERYRGWLVFAALLVVGGLVHTARVEYLVRARTRELRQALATREAMEREARLQQEKLDHLARLGILGELESTIAHELNQPLSAIGNFARGMERRIEAGRLEPEPLLGGCQEIAEQAERARGIMQHIRAFAQKRGSERAALSLAEVVGSAVALFEGIGEQAPRVRREVEPGARVWADRLQIEQVLLNLLKNALDAMQDLPPAERAIALSCRREDGMHRVCVTDTGAGLDEATRARLFEPFFTTKPEGLGLGLSLSKSIVEAHGGRLWAEPNPAGRGLSVCFTLPVWEEG